MPGSEDNVNFKRGVVSDTVGRTRADRGLKWAAAGADSGRAVASLRDAAVAIGPPLAYVPPLQQRRPTLTTPARGPGLDPAV